MSQGSHVDKTADESQRVLGDVMEDIESAIASAQQSVEAYPVGSVFMAEDAEGITDPADALGYGTWIALADETVGEDEAARTFNRWLRIADADEAEGAAE